MLELYFIGIIVAWVLACITLFIIEWRDAEFDEEEFVTLLMIFSWIGVAVIIILTTWCVITHRTNWWFDRR